MPDLRILLVRRVRAESRCSACGSQKQIEFHHYRKKRFTLGDHSIIRRVPLHVVAEEIERCIPLCHDCHVLLHKGELSLNLKHVSQKHITLVRSVRAMLGTKPKNSRNTTPRKRKKSPNRKPKR